MACLLDLLTKFRDLAGQQVHLGAPEHELQGRPRRSPIRVRRARVGPALERAGHRRPRLGQHRSGRGMVEVKPVVSHENSRIPADCQLKRRPYIGAAAAAHPSADQPDFYASNPIPCPK
jgi:hypothetical protein